MVIALDSRSRDLGQTLAGMTVLSSEQDTWLCTRSARVTQVTGKTGIHVHCRLPVYTSATCPDADLTCLASKIHVANIHVIFHC